MICTLMWILNDTEILRYRDTVEADEVQDADVEDDEVGG